MRSASLPDPPAVIKGREAGEGKKGSGIGKGREGWSWIFVQGPNVPSYVLQMDPRDEITL